MEISKAQKLKREAQLRINEILNALADETGCDVKLDVTEYCYFGESVKYETIVTLTV